MNNGMPSRLLLCETDIANALDRFCGSEQLYITCLKKFIDDPTLAQLKRSIDEQSWDDAFTAAHALKGLAGNMGFVPLYYTTSELVILIRAGRVREIPAAMENLNNCYKEVVSAIKADLGDADAL